MRKNMFVWAVLISIPVAPVAGEPLVRVHTSYYAQTLPTVLAVKPASNGEDLEVAANTATQVIVAKHQALDEEYDRKTDHGRNQGATLL